MTFRGALTGALALAAAAACTARQPDVQQTASPHALAEVGFACQTFFGHSMPAASHVPRSIGLTQTRRFLSAVTLADLYFATPLVVQGVVGEAGTFAPAGHTRNAVALIAVVRNETGRRIGAGETIEADIPSGAAGIGEAVTLFLDRETPDAGGPYRLVLDPLSLWHQTNGWLGAAYRSVSNKTLRAANGFRVARICRQPLLAVRRAKSEPDVERFLRRKFGVESRYQSAFYRTLLRSASSCVLLEWAVQHDGGPGRRFPTRRCGNRRSANCLD